MTELIDKYLSKNDRFDWEIHSVPVKDLELIVVIPAYKEYFDTLIKTLGSLFENDGDIAVELLILFNAQPNEQELHELQESIKLDLEKWIADHCPPNISCYVANYIFKNKKKAGVGSARKMLMDTALARFNILKKAGLIVNLDADTKVSSQYFMGIVDFFRLKPKVEAAGLFFEHPLDESPTIEQNQAIVQYELHLRYFINMQRTLSLPFAFQTIGSAMVVRTSAYASEGGMVRKQAGEDFYFLHKYIRKFSFCDLNEVVVYPSGRVSDRVPFGTGKAVADHLDSNQNIRLTYHYRSFEILEECLKVKLFYEKSIEEYIDFFGTKDKRAADYFTSSIAIEKLKEIKKNTTDYRSFYIRFFRWFDAFQLMKYLHHMRDNGLSDIPIDKALRYYMCSQDLSYQASEMLNLKTIRTYDKKRNYFNEVLASIPGH